MRAASRESLATSRERLFEAVRQADGPTRERLAAELRQVAALLIAEPGLRRALSDASKPDEARVGLLEALLGSKLDAASLDVLYAVVAAKWSSPGELLDGIERLSIDAELAAAEADDVLADVEDQLFRFGRIVEGDRQLAGVLNDQTVEVGRRQELVRNLLDGKSNATAGRLAEFAVQGFGGRGFDASLQRLVELAAERRDREIAYVRAAAPLTADQENRLAAQLGERYGRAVSVRVEIDESLIGGVVVRIGDDLYDGSVSRRLGEARAALTKK